jgi:hypothetical protein
MIRLSGGLLLRVQVGGAIPVVRKTFVVAPYGNLHQASVVALRVAIGPEFQF